MKQRPELSSEILLRESFMLYSACLTPYDWNEETCLCHVFKAGSSDACVRKTKSV